MSPAANIEPPAAKLSEAIAAFADRLITPALVIDLDAVAHNLAAACARFGGAPRWRPHLKTCKQAEIVTLMLAAGVRTFKVATCDELALVLGCAGSSAIDVWLAYPPQLAVLRGVLELAAAHPHATVSVLADGPEHLDQLGAWLGEAGSGRPDLGVALDVDLGMNRTGATPERWRALAAVPAGLRLVGLHGYDGHLGWTQVEAAHAGYDRLVELAAELSAKLAPARAPDQAALELVTSGTHSYAHALSYPGFEPFVHRVSPGTIVLNDRRSHAAAVDIGLRQAAFVATRVISVGPGRATLDAGSKGIAPDVPAPSSAVLDRPELQPGQASEEHLPCAVAPSAEPPALGELLWLVPEHVCTTVNLHREAIYLRDGAFVGLGPVAAAGHRPRYP